MAKTHKSPPVTTRRNKPGTSKFKINSRSPPSTTRKNNEKTMSTLNTNNINTRALPIDQISMLKTSEKPSEQPTTVCTNATNTPRLEVRKQKSLDIPMAINTTDVPTL